jgi:hypothetical protein
MQELLLKRIRLSWYFVILLVAFGLLVYFLPSIKFEGGALTLFSVNSFLYGFYLAPIFSGQKARIEDLHKTARNEANAVFAMVLGLKKLPAKQRNKLQEDFTFYLKTCALQRRAGQGEEQYEALIGYCVQYDGEHKDEIDKLLEKLVANQQNRTQLSMLLANKVYSHEWIVVMVLFCITIGFVLTIETGDSVIFDIIAAFLASGLSMLLVILVKFSTLTHKKAGQVWDPYKKLVKSHYYRID